MYSLDKSYSKSIKQKDRKEKSENLSKKNPSIGVSEVAVGD